MLGYSDNFKVTVRTRMMMVAEVVPDMLTACSVADAHIVSQARSLRTLTVMERIPLSHHRMRMIDCAGHAKRYRRTSTVTRYMGTPCAARESLTTRQYASEPAFCTMLLRPARRSAAAAAAAAASRALR